MHQNYTESIVSNGCVLSNTASITNIENFDDKLEIFNGKRRVNNVKNSAPLSISVESLIEKINNYVMPQLCHLKLT